MFKLYRKSQEAQFNWMRNHPVQYVALNATLIVVGIVAINYWDRRETRKYENEDPQQDN